MKVREIMATDVVALQADEPVIHAVEFTASERIRHLPILEGDKLVGIVSMNDIKHATPSPLLDGSEANYRRVFHETPLRRLMRRAPLTAAPDDDLGKVVRLMVDNRVGAVPVVEDEKLVGIVSELDVLRVFLKVLDILE